MQGTLLDLVAGTGWFSARRRRVMRLWRSQVRYAANAVFGCGFAIWLRGQDLPVRVFSQSTGLIYRLRRTSLTLQVLLT